MPDTGPGRLLAGLAGPRDLDALDGAQLRELAAEVRAALVEQVTRTGGHLGPNLGVVELTIALHRVFDSPRDALVWDVGHQAYVHKMLTGRAAALPTLRRAGGLSGYPSPAESPHDVMGDSHASTALAWADGLARAVAAGARAGRVVAVVGDGALTGGMAWEGLDALGAAPQRPVVVVLNDNGRSYDPTVGAAAAHLAGLRERWRATGEAQRSDLFTALGLAYRGPVDGHDLPALEEALAAARDLGRPVVVHVVTRKGAGHPAAEADRADCLHAVPPAPVRPGPARPSWTAVLGAELAAVAAERPDVVAVTAAMRLPTGLGPLAGAAPDRVHDVGIAEQHAVTSAAGMAAGGLHPVVCLYSTFLNRAYDQLVMDVALQRLPVTLVLDRAGVTGPDGPSHHGVWDLPLLASVPGLRVAAPRDAPALRALLREAVAADGPTALRFPKGSAPPVLGAVGRVGGADVLRRGDGAVLLVGVGPLAAAACAAAEELAADGVAAGVVDPRWVLPVDPGLVEHAARHRAVVVAEDGAAAGGVGDALARALREAGAGTRVRSLGVPRAFLPHGEREDLLRACGLDADGIAAAALAALAEVRAGVRGEVRGERAPARRRASSA